MESGLPGLSVVFSTLKAVLGQFRDESTGEAPNVTNNVETPAVSDSVSASSSRYINVANNCCRERQCFVLENMQYFSCIKNRFQNKSKPWSRVKKCIVTLIVALVIIVVADCIAITLITFLHRNDTCLKAQKVFVLIDISNSSDHFLAETQRKFALNVLKQKLNESSMSCDLHAYDYDNDTRGETDVNFFHHNKRSALEESAFFKNPLNIGRALGTLYKQNQQECSESNCTIIVMASGQGEDFQYALGQAKYLMDCGIEVIVICVGERDETLQHLASTNVNSEWMFIRGDNLLVLPAVANVTLDNMQDPRRTFSKMPSTVPFLKYIIVLQDVSESVTDEEKVEEHNFVDYFTETLNVEEYKDSVMFSALNFSTGYSGSWAVTSIANYRQQNPDKESSVCTFTSQKLNVNITLQSLFQDYLSKDPPARTTIIILVSKTGDEIVQAAGAVKRIINHGDHVIAVAFRKYTEDLRHIASCRQCAFDGTDAFQHSNFTTKDLAHNVAGLWESLA